MGYSITIGNAKPEFSKDDGELWARWTVDGETHPDAPTFPNDEMTGNGNCRSPSYSGWSDFCRAAGIHDMFLEKYEGLMSPHPGCKMLSRFRQALAPRRSRNRRPSDRRAYPARRSRDPRAPLGPAVTDPDVRIVLCPDCKGDKGFAVPVDIDRRDGSLIERWEPCAVCEAIGEIEIEVEPVEMEDIEILPLGPYMCPQQRGADPCDCPACRRAP